MFKLIGPLNPPRKGSLIMLDNNGRKRMGQVVKAEIFSRNGNGNKDLANDPREVLFFSGPERKKSHQGQSPFGDVGYEIEIVWATPDHSREFWVLTHPEPTAIGTLSKKQDVAEAQGFGIVIAYQHLPNKVSVLVA